MAENGNVAAGQQQFKCTGNCLKCNPGQRAYCASQHAYSNMRVLDKMMDEMIAMKGTIMTMAEKIDAIQNNEATVFDPTIAQEGSGVIE